MLENTKNIVLYTANAGFPRDALTDKTKTNNQSSTTEQFPISSVTSVTTINTPANNHAQVLNTTAKITSNVIPAGTPLGAQPKSSIPSNIKEEQANILDFTKQQNTQNTQPYKLNTTKSTDERTEYYLLNQTESDTNVTGMQNNENTHLQHSTFISTASAIINACIDTVFDDIKSRTTINKIQDSEIKTTLESNVFNLHNIKVKSPPSPISYKHIVINFWPKLVKSEWPNLTYANIYEIVRSTGLPNYLKARIPLPSGLKIQNWKKLLTCYHDNTILEFLEYGWPVDYTSNHKPIPTYKNHLEKEDYSKHINNFIDIELKHNALLGPFNNDPFSPWCQYSPIMTSPKKNTTDRRIIVDLSFPKGKSVNSGIKRQYYLGKQLTYSLPGINDIINKLNSSLSKKFLWTIDLARAYRQLRTDPLSVPLLGITVNNKKYFDIAPPFGCRTSSMACARTTNAIVYLLKNKGYFVLCYLDDFIGVENNFKDACKSYKECLDLLKFLGLDISVKKCVPPTQQLTWLGYNINAKDLVIKIPNEKLQDIINECKLWNENSKVSRKYIQHIAGKLNFISKCVTSTKVFMNRILAFLRSSPYKGTLQVTSSVLQDISWFIRFSEKFNGLILLPKVAKELWVIECDACISAGGGFSKTKYFAQQFQSTLVNLNLNIAQIEAVNLIVALCSLSPQDPYNYDIQIITDNMASQQVLATGHGRDSILTACARKLWLFSSINNCTVNIIHRPGATLIVADALSRAHMNTNCKTIATNFCITNNLERVLVDHFEMLNDILTCL